MTNSEPSTSHEAQLLSEPTLPIRHRVSESGLRVMLGFVLAVGLAACASESNSDGVIVMPDVVGLKLDVALSDIERAGVDEGVDVVGGGMLGVVVELNWEVCHQSPPAGETVAAPLARRFFPWEYDRSDGKRER